MNPQTRSDAVHLESAGADAGPLRVVGTLPGMYIFAASTLNGTGHGLLIAGVHSDGVTPTVAWQAPGSSTPGAPCPLTGEAAFLVEDGEDPDKWVRVYAYPAYCGTSGEAKVFFKVGYNALGPSDVTAGDAAAGLVITTTFTLKNYSFYPVTNVKLWIYADPAVQVSKDNISFFAPTDETDPNVLVWSSIAAGASANVYVKRTISASTAFDPARLVELRFAWTGF